MSLAGSHRSWSGTKKTGRIVVRESDRPAKWPISIFLFRERPAGAAAHSRKADDKLAKFWLAPVREAYNYGFSPRELNRIAAITHENEPALLKAWHDYFNRDDGTGDGQEGPSD
jgi:hypothetical protein